jgi:hypothetical protein
MTDAVIFFLIVANIVAAVMVLHALAMWQMR